MSLDGAEMIEQCWRHQRDVVPAYDSGVLRTGYCGEESCEVVPPEFTGPSDVGIEGVYPLPSDESGPGDNSGSILSSRDGWSIYIDSSRDESGSSMLEGRPIYVT